MPFKTPIAYILATCLLCLNIRCIKPYEPPEIVAATSLLVVDGMLQAGSSAGSTVRLSRTRRLTDTASTSPETGARVELEGPNAERYPFSEGPAGLYRLSGVSLQPAGKYRLWVETTDGTKAASDYVSIRQTPAIDSLTWEEKEGQITIYLHTHDPNNDTRYYRWELEETWEQRAYYDAVVGFENGTLFFLEPHQQRYRCWQTALSSNILLGASASLAQDVISSKPLITIKAATRKMGYRYSALVRQFALTKEAFQYWQILQKNTEQRGSFFDAQPSQLVGNIRNISRPDEPVVGYLSASTVQEKRLFIKSEDIRDRFSPQPGCPVQIVPGDSAVFYLESFKKFPAYYITGGGLAITSKECVDCTLQGGTNIKPSFW